YAALSYVWGGDQPGKTTSQNVKAHFEGIALSDLPTTLRDAVQVTREIGLRYLWIDSLCILQDDKQDQAVEIAKMPEYYGNASITIVAAESYSANDGFLQKPSIKWIYSDFAFELPYSLPDGQLGSVKFISRQNVKFGDLPINRRGWTYQEALLSSHLVVFHQNGVELCCNRDCHGSANDYVQSVTRLQLNSLRQLAAETLSSAGTLLEAWPRIVYTYSTRNLTNPSDKLLAISGIATEMGRTLPFKYMAGLWVPLDKSQWRSLIWQLLWCAGSGIIDCFPSTTYDYRAPSWSWAAIDELTGYPPAFNATSEPVHKIMHFEILDISIDLEHPQAPFGAVTGGRLVVRARLKAVKHMRQLLFMPDTVEDEEMFKDPREHGKMWCAVILHVWDVFRGLVLKQVTENTYQRIGCFSFDSHSTEVAEKMFRHSQDREIVII
ncbi:HET-domain-containing protein, partial [Hyaloscypha hepaticicola]